ncbi:hypothetical protein JW859_05440 [bacterium]|nr:hypothetical protein [bacterium]
MFTRRIAPVGSGAVLGWLAGLALIALAIAGCPQQEQQDSQSNLTVKLPGTDEPVIPDQAGLFSTPEPGQWPAEFPQYAGAQIQSYEPNSGDETAGFTMQFLTADTGEQVIAFYREYAAAEGYTETESVLASDSGAVYFERENGQLTLGYNPVPEGTTITVMITPFQLTPENVAPSGSERLPINFPVDILKLYPGGNILNAENLPMDNILDQHIPNATRKEVMAFYKAHYEEIGFTVKRSEEKDTWAEYVFTKPGFGNVVFTLNIESDNTISLHQILGRF